ncbi:MAG: AAA family ATPase [Stenomitos rutilans HA7619-LM2]|jgi:PAS domain S-box-containing protein|nr:AAA family ATPase [Stenomitos rutilans HA7619-LM2]
MTFLANTSPHPLPEISGYTVVEKLYLGSRTAVYRAVQTAQQRPVVIKLLRREHLSFGELVQFRNQYTIAKNLPIPGVVQPLSLEPLGHGYALVMEDCGGVALGKYIQERSLALPEILAIALQLADILHALCQHQVVHKDIKPANILIHPESKQIKLIDFSIASLLPKETQEIQNPNILEGTLAYLAPEQTGRMNRSIDYRTDFYALGVTLYQLLTGTLPFASDDPLELVHCHIAKMPVSVDRMNPAVPEQVSAIVTKLMAKNAEDRYQSAPGLKHDLEHCLTQWQETGAIADFALGQRDLSDRFLIPEKLYGRETEVQTLLEAFDRAAGGSSEVMLVAGFSGIGKTAVVNEVHKPITRQQGYFIKGKYDQFNRNIPLSAFVQALRDLIAQLLSESDVQLAQWRTKILAAVGENGQVLIEVIPELEQIIGQQSIAPELSSTAAQNRFNLLFQKFIKVFTTPEHPLVVFLDDLQWADSASLQLIELLVQDQGHLLLLGAYRNNEVSAAHPFIMMVEELKKTTAIVNTITLTALAFADTNRLIADTLNCTTERSHPLTELIIRKTQGNPFFTGQFLKALHADEHITFNPEQRYWECDIAQINALSLTNDVVEFMALQLQKLPAETQQILKLAACVGNQFDLATLAIVSEQSLADAATALWKSLQEGLILPTNQTYKFFQNVEQSERDSANPHYRFLHDRVQQAAYSLIPDEQKQTTHLAIGQLLLNGLSAVGQSEILFDIVNHINFGQFLIKDKGEKEKVARLNLAAAQKAIASTAYEAAIRYLETGVDLLGEEAWNNQYDLMFKLYHNLCAAQLSHASYEQLSATTAIALQHISSSVDRADIYVLQVTQHTLQGECEKAIQIGLIALSDLGIEVGTENLTELVREEFAAVAKSLENRSISSLLDLPTATDPVIQATIKLLIILDPPVYITANIELYSFVSLRAARLSIEYGNIAESIKAYANYGFVLGLMEGQYQRGYEFTNLAVQLSYKLNSKSQQCKAELQLGGWSQVWAKPVAGAAAINYEGFLAGMESGEIQFAAYNLFGNIFNRLFEGENLTDVAEDIEKYRLVAEQVQDELLKVALAGAKIFVAKLLRQVQKDDRVIVEAEEIVQQGEATQTLLSVCLYYILRMHLACLTADFERGHHYFIEAGKILNSVVGFTTYSGYFYYGSLILLNLYPGLSQAEQSSALEQIRAHQERLKTWSENCPENFLHKYLLVEAEHYRVLGRKAEAIDLYDRAIAGANENDYIQEAALANELAANFYLEWGKERIAQEYLIEAYYGYAHWGAKAKIVDLETRYPTLLASMLQQERSPISVNETVFASSTVTSIPSFGSISDALDLAAILKASHTLSSAIELGKLLSTLLQLVIENAGADKCVLMLMQDDRLFVKGIGTLEADPIVMQRIPVEKSQDIPLKLIYRVKNRLEPVVLMDATANSEFVVDPYFLRQHPKSLLCSPILHQGKLLGIVYLENQLTIDAFTHDRVQILNLLCAQATISIENARLYAQAKQALEDAKLMQFSIDRVTIPICWVESDARISYANDALCQDWGYPREEIVGSYVYDFDPNFSQKTWAHHWEEIRQQGSVTTETHIRNKGGMLYPVEVTVNHMTFQEKEYHLTFAVNISDRKRAEQEKARLLAILEATPDIVGIADPVGNNLYLNQAGQHLLEIPAEETNQFHISEVIAPTFQEMMQLAILPTAMQQGSWAGEMLICSRSREEIPVSQVIVTHKNAQGEIEFLSTIMRDIREQKRVEAVSKDFQERLSLLIQQAPLGIVEWNDEFKVTGWNPAAEKIFGYSLAEMQGQHAIQIVPEVDRPRIAVVMQTLIDQQGGFYSLNQNIRKDGTLITCEWINTPLLNTEGHSIGVFSIVQDVSDRTRTEAAIMQKSQELAQALQELQQAQLQIIQSEKMSALGNLVAGVAHEINNPVGFIAGNLQPALDYVKDMFGLLDLYQQEYPHPSAVIQNKIDAIDLEYVREDLPKLVGSMKLGVDRIRDISTSLRTFSRADKDYKVLFNIHDGIDSTILILKHRLKANENRPAIEVVTNYGMIPEIKCFPGQLNQVFMNILANAIDTLEEASQKRSFADIVAHPKRIEIQTQLDDSAQHILIHIRDNGMGMCDEVKQRVFDHLFTTKAVDKGTGLGLAIAHQIVVEKHDGNLDVESELGQGTEFCIRLPMLEKTNSV